MLRSTVINPRQPVGLQELAALAAVAHSSLGPNKRYKFIQDDTSGDSALVCSCFRIFENLELSSAVAQLVHETVQAQQKVFSTGSGCLLFLAGAWSRAALECVHRGISASSIISGMSDGFDICVDVLRRCSISIDGLGAVKSDSCTTTSPGLGLQMSKTPITEDSRASHHLRGTTNHKTLNTSGHRKVKLSRHFCQPESTNVSTAAQPHQLFNVGHIAEGLSHGCVQAMNLVVEVVKLQSEAHQDFSCSTFDVTKLVTCVVPGLPEERACVLPGCIVLLSDEQASVAHHLKDQPLKVALIIGDLSHTFRHLGFSRPAGVQHVSEQLASGSDEEEVWLVKVVALLLNLEVNLILVTGLASENVIQHCCGRRVLVVDKVKASILKAFADATAGVPVTYATQLTKHCVGTGVKVEIRRELGGGGGSERKSSTAVSVSPGGNSGLFTVILTSCVRGKLQALDDQFWASAYRLHHALKDRAVLPGAGATEMLCIHHLRHRAATAYSPQESTAGGAADLDRGVVLQLMADGLIDFISTVMVNTGRVTQLRARTVVSQQLQERNGHVDIAAKLSQLVLEGEHEDSDLKANEMDVYDNVSVKQEAWRKALDLLFLVLQTDAEVITGVDLTTGAQENLMLL